MRLIVSRMVMHLAVMLAALKLVEFLSGELSQIGMASILIVIGLLTMPLIYPWFNGNRENNEQETR